LLKKILLAEDEPVLRMLVSDTLEDEGYAIEVACDGEEALDHIKSQDYDLVILDHMMPKLTGLEVITEVRAIPQKRNLKILMLSAKSQYQEQEKVRLAGADEFMSKPFSPIELVRKVGEMLV
jgi:DNA-binding response OmpR family regulator